MPGSYPHTADTIACPRRRLCLLSTGLRAAAIRHIGQHAGGHNTHSPRSLGDTGGQAHHKVPRSVRRRLAACAGTRRRAVASRRLRCRVHCFLQGAGRYKHWARVERRRPDVACHVERQQVHVLPALTCVCRRRLHKCVGAPGLLSHHHIEQHSRRNHPRRRAPPTVHPGAPWVDHHHTRRVVGVASADGRRRWRPQHSTRMGSEGRDVALR